MSLKSLLKKEKKANIDAFYDKDNLKKVKEDFLRFQLEHNARFTLVNEFAESKDYQRNIIVDMIMSGNNFVWRPMTKEERSGLEKVLEAGIKDEESKK